MALTPRVTTRLLPGGVRETTQTRTVNTTLIPWIRSRKVYFKMEGLLPNTKHRAFFDGVDVSAWVREESFIFVSTDITETLGTDEDMASLTGHPETASDLISDANGTIEGSFFIPNTSVIRFRTGTREFKVRDWNATSDQNAVSKAFASYTATGTLDTQQTTITTIRPIVVQPPRMIDPVAQSFQIEKNTGAYVSSVDVFFKTKAAVTPVRLQLREMENGTPTQRVVPGAEKMLLPAAVNISTSPDVDTAGTVTTFTFDAPVYLEGFREYAIVVLAESIDYEVWTAVTQEFEVGSTTRRITKQPSLGSFFKSQNGSTWTPDQSRDLMFRIKRAKFLKDNATTAYFENVPVQSVRLQANPIEVLDVQATPNIRVYLPNHGMTTGSKITLSGLAAVEGITAGQLNTTHTITDAQDFDSFEIAVAGATSTGTGFGGGTAGIAEIQNQFDVMFPNVNQLTHPNTAVDWSAKYTTGASPTQVETDYQKDTAFTGFRVNENNPMTEAQVIAAPSNEADASTLNGRKSMTWKASMSSNTDYVAPVIDLGRMSATLIRNRIDNQVASAPDTGENVPGAYVAETDAQRGSTAAKHLFIPITLEEEAIGLKVLFAANRPANTFIDLYYRVAGSGSDASLTETDWTLATIDETVPTDDDSETFREYEYTIDESEPFTRYQYKIVFRAQTTTSVPRIRDFRSIALAT
jgi:hypothetical protein